MNKKRMASLIALTVMLILILGNIAMAHAQSSQDSTGTINVVAECTISSPELWDSGWSTDKNETQLTVNTEYRVNFTVSDQDGMDDISYCYVKIWDTSTSSEDGANDENDHYTFKWDGATWSCLGPGAGFYKGGAGSASASLTQYEFYVGFNLSKVAQYSNAGPTYDGWKVTINASDTEANVDTETQCLGFGVAEYMEETGLSTTHSWDGLLQGSTNTALTTPVGKLTFTAIANRVWNATAKSNATTAHVPSLGYTLGIGNVTFYSSDNVESSIPLTTNEQVIGTLDAQAVPSSESGTEVYCYLWVDIPADQPPGAYVYKLTITVQKD